MLELKKLIWKGLLQLFPDELCVSSLHGYSYLFFKGFKIIRNVDNSIDVFDTHIGSEYYTDKYGIERPKDYVLVKDLQTLTNLKNKIDVEINNKQNILSS